MQRVRLAPTCLLLSGQVERLACVLPGLAASRRTTDLAEPYDAVTVLQRARADIFYDRLLQQHAPLREAPLERSGIAQPAAIGCNQARLPEARQRARPCSNIRMAPCSGPLGWVWSGRGSRGQRLVSVFGLPAWRGGAPLPVAPALSEGPERAQGPR